MSDECLFCAIVKGSEPCVRVWEDAEFIAIENKFPKAPIHVLVMPKLHVEKNDSIHGSIPGYWDRFMDAVSQVVKQYGLDRTGYKLVNNGAGHNHFSHEHMHVLGGSKEEPAGET